MVSNDRSSTPARCDSEPPDAGATVTALSGPTGASPSPGRSLMSRPRHPHTPTSSSKQIGPAADPAVTGRQRDDPPSTHHTLPTVLRRHDDAGEVLESANRGHRETHGRCAGPGDSVGAEAGMRVPFADPHTPISGVGLIAQSHGMREIAAEEVGPSLRMRSGSPDEGHVDSAVPSRRSRARSHRSRARRSQPGLPPSIVSKASGAKRITDRRTEQSGSRRADLVANAIRSPLRCRRARPARHRLETERERAAGQALLPVAAARLAAWRRQPWRRDTPPRRDRHRPPSSAVRGARAVAEIEVGLGVEGARLLESPAITHQTTRLGPDAHDLPESPMLEHAAKTAGTPARRERWLTTRRDETRRSRRRSDPPARRGVA